MKLHLPKLLLTAVLATCSMAQAETFSPLSSEDGWTTSKRGGSITFTTEEGKVEHSNAWGQQASTYNFDTLLTAEQGDITFSITLQSSNYSNLIGVALQGSSEAIVLGSPVYGTNSVGYDISDNPTCGFYVTGGQNWANLNSADVTVKPFNNEQPSVEGNTSITITGTIANSNNTQDKANDNYVLTLSYNGQEFTTSLGGVADLQSIVLYSDGAQATFSGLQVTGSAVSTESNNLSWNGTETNNTWSKSESATPWVNGETASHFTTYDRVTFGAVGENMSNTVNINGEIVTLSLNIQDSYTFQMNEGARLYAKDISQNEAATLTIAGSGQTFVEGSLGGSVTLNGGSLTVYDGSIKGNVNVKGGELSVSGEDAISGSELNISNGTVNISHITGVSSSAISKNTAVKVGTGGTLHVSGHDSLGWGSAKAPTILLESDDADKLATFILTETTTDDNGNLKSNSFASILQMRGNSKFEASHINLLLNGHSIEVSGVNNTIDLDVVKFSENNWNVLVNESGELRMEITNLTHQNNKLIKKGTGTLTMTENYSGQVEVQAGEFIMSENKKLTGNVNVTGGVLSVSGENAISGSELNISNGIVNISYITGSDRSAISKNTAVKVGTGGTLHVSGHDSLGWGSATAPTIQLESNDADKLATLILTETTTNDDGTLKSNSFASILQMSGNSKFEASHVNLLLNNHSLEVSGENNTITLDTVKFSQDKDWNILVNESGALKLAVTNIDGNKKLIKKGDGILTLTEDYSKDVEVQSGQLVVDSGKKITGKVNVTGGSLVVSSSGALGGSLASVQNGEIIVNYSGGGESAISHSTTVEVGNGGTLRLNGHDSLAWGIAGAPAKILLEGSSKDSMAKMIVNDPNQTFTWCTPIEMKGYSQISGSSNTKINVLQAPSLTAEDVGNVIDIEEIQARGALNIEVKSAGELEIKSIISTHKEANSADILNKTGEGTLKLSGANTWENGTNINAGTIVANNATALGKGAVSVAKDATLELSADLTVSSDLTIAEGGSLIFGNGTTLSVGGTLTLDASAVQLGFDIISASDVVLATTTTTGGMNISNVDSWTGAREYTFDGKTYTAGLSATNDTLSLIFKEMIVDTTPITTTVASYDVAYNEETKTSTLTLTVNADKKLGEGMVVNLELISEDMMQGILEQMGYPEGDPMVFLKLVGTNGGEILADTMNEVVFVKGTTGQNYWGEMVGGKLMYNVNRIPEPTTTTLSLLALSALAMRRRRK